MKIFRIFGRQQDTPEDDMHGAGGADCYYSAEVAQALREEILAREFPDTSPAMMEVE